ATNRRLIAIPLGIMFVRTGERRRNRRALRPYLYEMRSTARPSARSLGFLGRDASSSLALGHHLISMIASQQENLIASMTKYHIKLIENIAPKDAEVGGMRVGKAGERPRTVAGPPSSRGNSNLIATTTKSLVPLMP